MEKLMVKQPIVLSVSTDVCSLKAVIMSDIFGFNHQIQCTTYFFIITIS